MLVASAALMIAPSARAQAGRTLTVVPDTDLDRQVVVASWTGFMPTRTDGTFAVIVLQCRADPTSLADCHSVEPFPQPANGNRILGFTAEDGTGSARFEVRPAKDLPELDCSSTNPCSLLAYENDGTAPPLDALPPSAVVAPIRFARSVADCPSVESFDVRVDGSASAAPAFYRWAADRCLGDDPQVIDFTETSSTTGRENFLAGLVDLGITPVAASDEELAAHPEHPEFAYAPIDATAVAIVFNMKDPFTGRRIDDLVLSPRLVTRIVTNSDIESFFNDPELRRLNPTTRFPSTALSKPLLRAERDGDTRLVTTWMTSSREAKQFLAERDPFGVPVNQRYRGYSYPVDVFEAVDDADPAYLPRTGQSQVALRLFYGVSPTGNLPQPTELYGFIGIVDLPTAERFGLPAARILNASGTPVAPTDEAVAKGIAAMDVDEHGLQVANLDDNDPAAYPLVKIDYAMVPLDLPHVDATADESVVDKRAEIADVLEYAVGPGQDLLPTGFQPLGESLRARTRAIAALLTAPRTAGTTTTTTFVPPPFVPFDPGNSYTGGTDTVPTFTTAPTTTSTKSTMASATTIAEPTTTTAVEEVPGLPTRNPRAGVALMFGTVGLSLFGWGAGGSRSAVRRTRRALRSGRASGRGGA